MLLSHVLKCGCCGGGFSKISLERYGCSTARNKNTCQNRLTIRQDDVEGRVIRALQAQLMDPELLKVFCAEYTAHLNALRGAATASRESARQELSRLERDSASASSRRSRTAFRPARSATTSPASRAGVRRSRPSRRIHHPC
jgi:hypothetical protein